MLIDAAKHFSSRGRYKYLSDVYLFSILGEIYKVFLKIEKAVFCVLFFMSLLVPLLYANRSGEGVSEEENRKLASPANLFDSSGYINNDFPQEYETWLNDNLGFREKMIDADGKIKYNLFNRLNGMRLGVHGELAPFKNLEDYQHTNLLSEDEIERITCSYQTICDYLNSQDIQVYYMQCWDKHSIYPEQYKNTIQVFGSISKTDQIEQALIEQTSIDVIPIKDKLISLKDKYHLYGTWAEPWHWVQRGAFVGYSELIKEINNKNNNKYRELTENDFNIRMKDIGLRYFHSIHKEDLEEVFTLKERYAVSKPEEIVFMPNVGMPGHAEYYENVHVDNDDTILIFGDSYFHDYGVINYLAESFHTTIMFNGTSATEDNLIKIIETYEPDIVVFENAERCNFRFDEMVDNAADIRSREYDNGSRILFNSDNNGSSKYMINGFTKNRDGSTWTEGNKATLFFVANGFEPNVEATINLDITGVNNGVQRVKILVNRETIFDENIGSSKEVAAKFIMPETNFITLSIVLDDIDPSLTLEQSNAKQRLGIMISEIRIEN